MTKILKLLSRLASCLLLSNMAFGDASSAEETKFANLSFSKSIAGRYGPILNITSVNTSKRPIHIVGAALVSEIKAPAGRTDGPKEAWVFASPLSVSRDQRILAVGPNVVDVAIQGYTIEQPNGSVTRQHFEFLFQMTNTRLKEYARQMPKDFSDPTPSVVDFLTSVINLDENDSAEAGERLSKFDSILISTLRIRVLLPDGSTKTFQIPIGATDLASWLANYVRIADKKLLLGKLRQ